MVALLTASIQDLTMPEAHPERERSLLSMTILPRGLGWLTGSGPLCTPCLAID